ncbi:hypothetical protein HF086_016732 [Spodoptera exigua]|uniref:Uncharacterized protein n=1 Tax=Spodoptera exigua TaxID=7107 RepID=A0A922SMG9_SPOEX|nr:hypothetical protein HF086_016732 [Spodoptera exigua]
MNIVLNADMPIEKDLKKIGRGAMVEKIAIVDDVKLSLVSWLVKASQEKEAVSNPGTPTLSRGNTPTSSKTGTPTSRNESFAPRKRARKTPAKVQDPHRQN